VFFLVAGSLAWPDARGNDMAVTMAREVPEDLRAGLGEVPRVAGVREWADGKS
jgi:hypothetical protein